MYQKRSVVTNTPREHQYPTLIKLIEILGESNLTSPCIGDGRAVLSIKFDEDGRPVRKVVRRSNYRQTYQLFSKKMKVTMSCESLIEFNACYILETTPDITSYQMQPAVITYSQNGEIHKHIPDALIQFNGQTKYFLEFKDQREAENEELKARTELLAMHLPTHGYGYLLIFNNQISGVCLTNAKKLFHIQEIKIPQEVLMDINDIFYSRKSLTIRNLMNKFPTVPYMKNYLYQLILNGIVRYDTELELTDRTELFWKGVVK